MLIQEARVGGSSTNAMARTLSASVSMARNLSSRGAHLQSQDPAATIRTRNANGNANGNGNVNTNAHAAATVAASNTLAALGRAASAAGASKPGAAVAAMSRQGAARKGANSNSTKPSVAKQQQQHSFASMPWPIPITQLPINHQINQLKRNNTVGTAVTASASSSSIATNETVSAVPNKPAPTPVLIAPVAIVAVNVGASTTATATVATTVATITTTNVSTVTIKATKQATTANTTTDHATATTATPAVTITPQLRKDTPKVYYHPAVFSTPVTLVAASSSRTAAAAALASSQNQHLQYSDYSSTFVSSSSLVRYVLPTLVLFSFSTAGLLYFLRNSETESSAKYPILNHDDKLLLAMFQDVDIAVPLPECSAREQDLKAFLKSAKRISNDSSSASVAVDTIARESKEFLQLVQLLGSQLAVFSFSGFLTRVPPEFGQARMKGVIEPLALTFDESTLLMDILYEQFLIHQQGFTPTIEAVTQICSLISTLLTKIQTITSQSDKSNSSRSPQSLISELQFLQKYILFCIESGEAHNLPYFFPNEYEISENNGAITDINVHAHVLILRAIARVTARAAVFVTKPFIAVTRKISSKSEGVSMKKGRSSKPHNTMTKIINTPRSSSSAAIYRDIASSTTIQQQQQQHQNLLQLLQQQVDSQKPVSSPEISAYGLIQSPDMSRKHHDIAEKRVLSDPQALFAAFAREYGHLLADVSAINAVTDNSSDDISTGVTQREFAEQRKQDDKETFMLVDEILGSAASLTTNITTFRAALSASEVAVAAVGFPDSAVCVSAKMEGVTDDVLVGGDSVGSGAGEEEPKEYAVSSSTATGASILFAAADFSAPQPTTNTSEFTQVSGIFDESMQEGVADSSYEVIDDESVSFRSADNDNEAVMWEEFKMREPLGIPENILRLEFEAMMLKEKEW
ncbi:hypothetical protein HK100_001011 [Physocladia obscura]|uniref:Uncharacterized protein n=1 Tax=Physocladia obscura TaxID=109957 RepID=A0AAD5XET7_9FUNG|nr:hypothetical protein HK100_001011 [Physocladia obscura]